MNINPPAQSEMAPSELVAAELAPSELAQRLDAILASVLLLVAACFRILGVRTVPLWNRISRSRRSLAHLLARLAAGHKPRLRKQAALAAAAAPTQFPLGQSPTAAPAPQGSIIGGAVAMPIPRRPLWLVIQLGYRAAGFGSQLNHLLHEPGVAETLAAAPGIARTLRPLCRMLGVDLPPALRLPPRPAKSHPEESPSEKPAPRASKPRALKPRAAPPPHRHPVYPQRKPRPLHFMPPFVKFGRTGQA